MRVFLATTLVFAATLLIGSLMARPDYHQQTLEAPQPIAPSQQIAGPRHLTSREEQYAALSAGGFVHAPRSMLRVAERMHYGDYTWNEEGVPEGPVSIRVDLRTQLLSVFRGGHEIGTAVVLYGADSKETPLGNFAVQWKRENHRSSLYEAAMPFTLRLTNDGIAIHGSEVSWGAATHGCIGVPTNFARHLFAEAKIGDPVVIVRSAASGAKARPPIF